MSTGSNSSDVSTPFDATPVKKPTTVEAKKQIVEMIYEGKGLKTL